MWPRQEINQQFSAAYNYPALSGGKMVSVGNTTVRMVNGIPAYLLFGKSTTTTDEHLITILDAGEDLQSLRVHNEEKGGTQDILRDTLGCVVANGVFSWDGQSQELTTQLAFLAGVTRDDQDGSYPSVELTNPPVLPTGSNATPFTFAGSNCWSKWDLDGTPQAFDMVRWDLKWANLLSDPVYVFGNGIGNWPTAIRKRRPGVGLLTVHFLCDTRWSHNAVINQLSKTMDFKFVKGSDPSNVYMRFELQNCMVQSVDMVHLLAGEDIGIAKAEIPFSYPEVYTKDGITDEATWYGE